MKQLWASLAARFNAYQMRERALISFMLLFVVMVFGFSLLVEPQIKQFKTMKGQIAQQEAQVQVMTVQLQVQEVKVKDPDATLHARAKELREEISIVESRLRDLNKTLVSPTEMAAFLEGMLQRDRQLQLVELSNLPATALMDAKSLSNNLASHDSTEPVRGGVYKHGVQITVEGSYADLLNYLLQLEHLPQRMFWSEVKLMVQAYPRSRMTVVVYTLSLDKDWLVV